MSSLKSTGLLLTLNGGSSSLKFALYPWEDITGEAPSVGRGQVSGLGGQSCSPTLKVKGDIFSDKDPPEDLMSTCTNAGEAAHKLLDWIKVHLSGNPLIAVGHRVVHGGTMRSSVRITDEILAYLRTLIPLAPLHEPSNVAIIEHVFAFDQNLPQVACFDTSFHTTNPAPLCRLPIPRQWHDKGLHRYGFHGLSYDFIAGKLQTLSPHAAQGRTIVAHLGSGASLCALKGGQSLTSSMGFSALGGLMMSTRTGDLDPGVVLYFLEQANLSPKEVSSLLWRESGLLGVSGMSADMAALIASDRIEAQEAVDLFLLRLTREIGGLAVILEGLDALVFTGGIGENATTIRARACQTLAWLGIDFDDAANSAVHGRATRLSTAKSTIEVWVVPTDEEAVIARDTRQYGIS